MAVYRVNKNRGYTVMANFHLRDKNLSLKAVGLLSKMLSFNDGWKFSTRGLSAICKEGPDAILSALRELERHGYSDMKYFTVEEINLMCCFNTSSRMRLIDDMESVTLNNTDGEIAELIYKTVQKLEAMSDAEFDALYIAPDSVMDD